MLTKSEALQVWCPMVRLVSADSKGKVAAGAATCNRVQDQNGTLLPLSTSCVADGCAMWRWDGKVKLPVPRDQRTWWPKDDEPHEEPARPTDVPIDALWVPLAGEGEDMEGGYWEEPREKVDAENAGAAAEARASMRGYCGLAGRPA